MCALRDYHGRHTAAAGSGCHVGAHLLEITGIEFVGEEIDLFAEGSILLDTLLHGIDGMQGRGMITVETLADGLQW